MRLGFFSFTEITDPAEHRSYNEWHQLDHMPEQFPLPGVAFGQRWVATPACRRARAVDGPLLGSVHYMTMYLMGEPIDHTLDEFLALGVRLRAEGRFHEARKSRLSGPLTVTGTWAAPRVKVSPEAVPYRPNRGIFVVVNDRHTASGPLESPSGPPWAAADDDDGAFARRLLDVNGVAGAWSFATDSRFDRYRWRPGNRSVVVCFLDDDPVAVSGALGERTRAHADSGAQVVFAGPFETITPWRWDWFDPDR